MCCDFAVVAADHPRQADSHRSQWCAPPLLPVCCRQPVPTRLSNGPSFRYIFAWFVIKSRHSCIAVSSMAVTSSPLRGKSAEPGYLSNNSTGMSATAALPNHARGGGMLLKTHKQLTGCPHIRLPFTSLNEIQQKKSAHSASGLFIAYYTWRLAKGIPTAQGSSIKKTERLCRHSIPQTP